MQKSNQSNRVLINEKVYQLNVLLKQLFLGQGLDFGHKF